MKKEIVENGNVKEIENMDEAAGEVEKFQKKREEMKANVKAKELIDVEISSEMREAYLNYAMSVIVARALPSAEDGLKPVHRRILWAMNEMGVHYNKQTKKSGRIVGDVMGKYHPHGDASIYDAMVRMAQSWSLRYPLVVGQGNFGCFTSDTQVKLADGRNLSFIDLINEHNQGKRNFIFTIDENKKIKIAEIKNPRKTRVNTEVMKVVLDNGEEIKCTLNHKFMLKSGEYKEAQFLESGDSLMPCYFRLSTKEDSAKAIGYSMVFQPRSGLWDFVHILSDGWNIEEGIYENDNNLLLCELNGNHKVVGVEFIKEFKDVYDLTVDKTHNFALASGIFVHNSMDGDSAAASRYTEAKMEKISNELLMDIDKNTVEMMKNYDNTLDEPIILPGKIPNLFLNGASGIAVGMATNIPPHNLGNTCDAIQVYLDNPDCDDKELIAAIKAPDFPTGGTVSGEIGRIYTEGRGKLILDGKAVVEEPKRAKDKLRIIITEIPYQVNKSLLVEQIATLARDKKLPDISDIRDESSKGKVRVVIELRKGAEEKFTLNRLYKYSQLRVSFNANMLALVNRVPKLLTLREYIKVYIGHRQIIIRKTKEFDLERAEKRLHIVEGLLIAQSNIDEVVKLIRASKAKTDAAAQLKAKYKLSDKQVEAILEMKLHQITSLEFDKLKTEEKDLKELIEKLKKILGDEKLILKIIKKDLVELKENYGDTRKTRVVGSVKDLEEHDLVDKKEVVVTITEKGYIKRLDLQQYKEQKRGGRGVIGSDLTEGDFIRELLTCNTHDYMLFFTDKGKVHWLKAYEIPASAKSTKGKAIVNLLELKDEKVTSVLAVKKFDDYLMMATEKGVVKKIELSQFANPRKGGIKAIKVAETEDTLISVEPLKEKQEVLLVTQRGQAIRFRGDDVRSMGRASYGVTGIKLDKGDKVVSLEVLPLEEAAPQSGMTPVSPNFSILTITRKGYGKRSAIEDYRLTGRAGKGVINMKVTDKTGKIVTSQSVTNSDNIIVMSEKGIVIRTPVKSIRIMGRATQGVRLIKLKEGDKVSDLTRVPTDEHIEEVIEE